MNPNESDVEPSNVKQGLPRPRRDGWRRHGALRPSIVRCACACVGKRGDGTKGKEAEAAQKKQDENWEREKTAIASVEPVAAKMRKKLGTRFPAVRGFSLPTSLSVRLYVALIRPLLRACAWSDLRRRARCGSSCPRAGSGGGCRRWPAASLFCSRGWIVREGEA